LSSSAGTSIAYRPGVSIAQGCVQGPGFNKPLRESGALNEIAFPAEAIQPTERFRSTI